MKKLIGFQLISRNEGFFNVHPLMESSFCVYSYQQIHDMHRKAGIVDWIVIPVFEGDIDLPTIMYEGELDVVVGGGETSELYETDFAKHHYQKDLNKMIVLFEKIHPYVEGECIESKKIQLENFDMACLTYDESGNVVVRNEEYNQFFNNQIFSTYGLSPDEISLFTQSLEHEFEEKELKEKENVMRKKKEIEKYLNVIYLNIGIDRPENHDQILEFCFNDVDETADSENWHSGDVSIAFRRFIETSFNILNKG